MQPEIRYFNVLNFLYLCAATGTVKLFIDGNLRGTMRTKNTNAKIHRYRSKP